jgi:hypothetical protein
VQNVRAVRVANGPNGELRCRIGGIDHRRVPYKGWVIIEPFGTADESVQSFCMMQRDEVRSHLSLFTHRADVLAMCETHRAIPYRGEGCSRLMCNHSNWHNTSSAEGSDLERI